MPQQGRRLLGRSYSFLVPLSCSPPPVQAQLLIPCHHGAATAFNIKTNRDCATALHITEIQGNLGNVMAQTRFCFFSRLMFDCFRSK